MLTDSTLRKRLAGRRVALLAHPASVTRELTHSLDALAALDDVRVVAAFGPQHGLRGDKQDNMIESPEFNDPVHGIPVFSLYGEVRRPTAAMMETFDVLLVDLQDLGCRVYTFITTLRYVLEEAAKHGKSVWILDRPNPAGRPVEGLRLRDGLGELRRRRADSRCATASRSASSRGGSLQRCGSTSTMKWSAMEGWQPVAAPGYGWPLGERTWVNPSPNAPNLSMARCYAGTVMLEGTTLSEGRGTTRPLELFGAPDIDARALVAEMHALAPRVAARVAACGPAGSSPRSTSTRGKLCAGVQIHVEDAGLRSRRLSAVAPARAGVQGAAATRSRTTRSGATSRTSTSEIGSPSISSTAAGLLREWVDDSSATPADLEAIAAPDEESWRAEREAVLLY